MSSFDSYINRIILNKYYSCIAWNILDATINLHGVKEVRLLGVVPNLNARLRDYGIKKVKYSGLKAALTSGVIEGNLPWHIQRLKKQMMNYEY